MLSAPPSMASTAAATGSGSAARRACRTVATWSMFTPSRIIEGSDRWEIGKLSAIARRLALHRLVDNDHEHEVREMQERRPEKVVHRERLQHPAEYEQRKRREWDDPRHRGDLVAVIEIHHEKRPHFLDDVGHDP